MANDVLIPTPLRGYVGKQDVVQVEGETVGELLQNLAAKYPELQNHLYNEDGRLRSFVNVYLNDDDIRYLQKEDTPVAEGDTISIVPSVAGGTGLVATGLSR
jgi:MoaD family protein